MDSLLGIDWGAAWRERSQIRRKPDDSAIWDARSKGFKENSGKSAYTDTFLRYLDIAPRQSVLDMGCGSGALAIPLARAGHEVISADFSAGMRQAVLERAQDEGLSTLQVMALDWNEDWEKVGIKPKSVDVVIASRSTIVDDLAAALLKLDRTARSKVAITMVTEYGPKGYRPLGSEQDGCESYVPDYIFGVNILLQMGAYPELRYIDSRQGNGGEAEGKLVRWAYLSWEPIQAKATHSISAQS